MDDVTEELDYEHSEPGDAAKDIVASDIQCDVSSSDNGEVDEVVREDISTPGIEDITKKDIDDELEEGEVTDDDSDEDIAVNGKRPLSPIRIETPPEQFSGSKLKPSPINSPQDSTNNSQGLPRHRPEEVGLCKFFLRGNCTWGDGCKFLHPPGAQRPPPMHPLPPSPIHMMTRPPRPQMDQMPPRYPERDIRMMRPIMSAPPRWNPPPMHRLPPPPIPPDFTGESAWERGLKEAKEMLLRKAQVERGVTMGEVMGEHGRMGEQHGRMGEQHGRMGVESESMAMPLYKEPTFEYHRQRSAPITQPVYHREKIYHREPPPLVHREPPVHELLPRTPSPVRSRSPATPGPEIFHNKLALERISPPPHDPLDSPRRSPSLHIPNHAYPDANVMTFEDLERKGVLPPPPVRPNHNHPPPKIYKGTSQGPLQRCEEYRDRERVKNYVAKIREEYKLRDDYKPRVRRSSSEYTHEPPVHHLPSRIDRGYRRESERRRPRSRERDEGRPLPYDRPKKRQDNGTWKDPWDRRRDKKKFKRTNSGSSGSNSSKSASSYSSRTPRARAVSLSSSSSSPHSRRSINNNSNSSRDSSIERNRGKESDKGIKSVASKAAAKALLRAPSPRDLYIKKSLEELSSSSSSSSSPSPERELLKVKEESPKETRKRSLESPEPTDTNEDSRKPFKMSMIAKAHVRLATGCAIKDEEVEGNPIPPDPPNPTNPQPPKKKGKEVRKEELLKQLKAVENAIAKKRSSTVTAV